MFMSELPSLLPLNRQSIIKSNVKIRVPVQCQCFDKRGVVFYWWKNSTFKRIRVIFWPEIGTLGVFLNFDNERMYPPKYLNTPGLLLSDFPAQARLVLKFISSLQDIV